VGSLLTALPAALVLGIAGLGLLGTIAGSLSSALSDEKWRESAVVTFLATASGMTLLGIGSAFWGLLAGLLTALVTRGGRRVLDTTPQRPTVRAESPKVPEKTLPGEPI
jgi:benzoate membrane transport protein